MIKNLIISFICTSFIATSFAQNALVKLWADQKIVLVGEDIWVDGFIQNSKPLSKTIHLQLLDRSGVPKVEADVMQNDQHFSASIAVPENLPSDYYFLDAVSKGMTHSTMLFPVMIINPNLPPTKTNCSFLPKKQSNDEKNIIDLYTDKDIYTPRDQVKLTLSGLNTLQENYLSVVRIDRLNTIYDQATKGFSYTVFHNAVTSAENEGQLITAVVKKMGKPVQGINVLASLKGNTSTLAMNTSNNEGVVKFLFPFKFDITHVLLEPLTSEQNISVQLMQYVHGNAIEFPCLVLEEYCRDDIEERLLHANVAKSFRLSTKIVRDANTDTLDFYGRPDARYNLDDYVRFPNMEEVIGEIIPEVRVKKIKGEPKLQILNIPFKFFFEEPGLVLVDGVPYEGTKEILEADPLIFKTIDVINRKYILGTQEFNGVVNFKTYKKDFGALKNYILEKTIRYKGIQPQANLKADVGVTDQPRIPDMRNIVFRANNIKSDFRGISTNYFMLSDAVGTYSIILRGIDKQGNISVSSKNFNVVK